MVSRRSSTCVLMYVRIGVAADVSVTDVRLLLVLCAKNKKLLNGNPRFTAVTLRLSPLRQFWQEERGNVCRPEGVGVEWVRDGLGSCD